MNRYRALWRTVPRELGYLLVGFPLALAGFGVTVTLFSGGLGTIITFFIGVLLIIVALYVARGFGSLDLALLEWTGRKPITRPEWQDARARTGFFGWLRAVLGNGHYWLYLLHTMLVDFIVKTVSWVVIVAWLSLGLGGVSYALWGWTLDDNPSLGKALLLFAAGVVALSTLPLVSRGLTSLHWLIARGMLGAFKSDALEREVFALSESRGAAHSAEGHSLRRLERDIHDGPQQRLVRLQMDLAAADRQLDVDPAKTRALIAEAMQQSREALEELRALSRGFAPPMLLDRGLIAALESAASRSSVPVRVTNDVPEGTELPPEIERNAYFIASECLTNAEKHSSATAIGIRVSVRPSPRVGDPADGDQTPAWLDLTVTDDGTGGAEPAEGHGLAGLQERVRGLGGTLELVSPDGGPTTVSAHLPLSVPAVPLRT